MTKLDVLDTPTMQELVSIIERFQFSLAMFTKFSELFAKARFHGASEDSVASDELGQLRDLGWLLFAYSRKVLLEHKSDPIESGKLLVAVLALIIRSLPPELSCETATAGSLESKLNGFLSLSNNDNTKTQEQRLQAAILELLATHASSLVAEHKLDLDCDMLGLHIGLVSQQIQKSLTPSDFDERYFISKAEVKIQAPRKYIPFLRQGIANKAKTPGGERKMLVGRPPMIPKHACKRLNYEAAPKRNSQPEEKTHGSTPGTPGLREIVFPKSAIQSPFMQARSVGMTPSVAAQIQATPMTVAMHIHSWLLECVSSVAKHQQVGTPSRSPYTGLSLTTKLEKYCAHLSPSSTARVCDKLNELVKVVGGTINAGSSSVSGQDPAAKKMQEHTARHRMSQMHSLMLHYFESLFDAESGPYSAGQLLVQDAVMKAVAICAAETVLFVHNILSVEFKKLLKVCKLDAFDFWLVMKHLLMAEPKMPQNLSYHFLEIEQKIVLEWAWNSQSSLVQMIQKQTSGVDSLFTTPAGTPASSQLTSQFEDTSDTEDQENRSPLRTPRYETFFRKVVEITSSRVLLITETLKLGEEHQESVWETVKHALSQQTELLFGRHIDQIILCSIYITSRVLSKRGMGGGGSGALSFSAIIQKYKELNQHTLAYVNQIIQVIPVEGRKADIITFYNKVFIQHLKDFAFSTIDGRQKKLASHQISTLAPPSPLRECVTMFGKNTLASPSPLMSPFSALTLTPRTKALYVPQHELKTTTSVAAASSPTSTFSKKQRNMERLKQIQENDEDEDADRSIDEMTAGPSGKLGELKKMTRSASEKNSMFTNSLLRPKT